MKPPIPLNKPSSRQPVVLAGRPPLHLNILIASMAMGGAERGVHDVLAGLHRRKPTGNLFLLHNLNPSYPVSDSEAFRVHRLSALEPAERMYRIAVEVLSSPSPVLYTHLIRSSDLRVLWDAGVTTIPVIQNSSQCWHDSPEAYDDPHVPFIVSVSEDVRRQLIEAGCRKQVVTLRHELQRWRTSGEHEKQRAQIRRQYGIRDDTLLIGMVGQFKAQKAYVRAVRVLNEVRKFRKAKLMVLGGWDHDYGAGRVAYTATMRLALELGVLPELLVPGSVADVEAYYPAFDVFLNTSIYEGLSVATLEALQAGCVVVTSDVGGQREILPPEGNALVSDPSDIDAYVRAIRLLTPAKTRTVAMPPPSLDLIPRLWCLLARYGPERNVPCARSPALAETLFVTSNLNPGGAQRSLTNLVSHLPASHKAWVCVLGPVLGERYLAEMERRQVPVVMPSPAAGLLDRAEHALDLAEKLGVRNIVYWNVEAPIKLLLTKVLHNRRIRLVDVSPGPMLMQELEQTGAFQRRICLDAGGYIRRLDVFVSKYTGGGPAASYALAPEKLAVIPNGVPDPGELPSPNAAPRMRLAEFDPRYALVTCCRIVPNKRVEWLLAMMSGLAGKIPEASLTIVGGVDQRHIPYWESITSELKRLNVRNIHFAGGNADVFSFLHEFRVFVMVSNAQGCPNASLEAMAAGLPVVANADGGTGEQVVDGVNGYLVSGEDPMEMATRVENLLRHSKKIARFGAAARRRARSRFSMDRMVNGYLNILNPTPDLSGASPPHHHDQNPDYATRQP